MNTRSCSKRKRESNDKAIMSLKENLNLFAGETSDRVLKAKILSCNLSLFLKSVGLSILSNNNGRFAS